MGREDRKSLGTKNPICSEWIKDTESGLANWQFSNNLRWN